MRLRVRCWLCYETHEKLMRWYITTLVTTIILWSVHHRQHRNICSTIDNIAATISAASHCLSIDSCIPEVRSRCNSVLRKKTAKETCITSSSENNTWSLKFAQYDCCTLERLQHLFFFSHRYACASLVYLLHLPMRTFFVCCAFKETRAASNQYWFIYVIKNVLGFVQFF